MKLFISMCILFIVLIWLARFIRRPYDRIVRSEKDGEPLLHIKYILYWLGRRIDLHKIEWPDPWGCFHSHPASWSIRIIIRGGYVEELYDGTMVYWRPGSIGIVRHDTVHRINRLLHERPSYSIWVRGKIRHQTLLKGSGWPIELQDTYHKSSEK